MPGTYKTSRAKPRKRERLVFFKRTGCARVAASLSTRPLLSPISLSLSLPLTRSLLLMPLRPYPLRPLSSPFLATEEEATMASAAPAVLNPLPLPHPIHPKVLPRIRRWQWHLWLSLADPAEAEAEAFPVVLYPLPLPLRTQASLAAAAVASALPLADPAEVAAAAFQACGSSGPLPPPTLPQASPTTDPTTAASPSDPGTSVALVCGSAAVCCCD